MKANWDHINAVKCKENRLFCAACSSSDAYNILSNCLHAVCSNCLNSIWIGEVYSCPVCKESSKNFIYNPILSKCDSSPKSPKCAWCEANGEETVSIGECKECDAWLCGECLKGHNRMPPLRSHTINLLHKSEDQDTLRCELHPHETLECFCEACGILTCRDCQLSVHRDHGSHRWVGEKAMLLKSPLEAAVKKLEDCQNKLIYSSSLASSAVETKEGDCFLASVERARSVIEARTVSLIMQIRARADSLLEEINAKSNESMKLLKAAESLMEQLNGHIMSALNFAGRLLTNADNDPASLVQLADAVQYRLETLHNRANRLVDDAPPSVDSLCDKQSNSDQAFCPKDQTAWRRETLGWRRAADTRALFVASWGGEEQLDRQTGWLSWLPTGETSLVNGTHDTSVDENERKLANTFADSKPKTTTEEYHDYLDSLALIDACNGQGSDLTENSGPEHPVAGGVGCAICFGPGLLAHCGRCRRAYHLDCHLPRLTSISLIPAWVCGLCEDKDAATAAHVEESDGTGLSHTDYLVGCRILMGLLVHAEAVHFTASVCPACSVPLLTSNHSLPHCPAGHFYHRLAELRLQLEDAAGGADNNVSNYNNIIDPSSCSPPVMLVGGYGDNKAVINFRNQRARLTRLDDWLIEVDRFWSDASREGKHVLGATKGCLHAARRIRHSLASLIRLHRPESEVSLMALFAETARQSESADSPSLAESPSADQTAVEEGGVKTNVDDKRSPKLVTFTAAE